MFFLCFQSVTNYFIANLALADVIIGLFSIPFNFQAALLQSWNHLPDFLCPFSPFFQVTTLLAYLYFLMSQSTSVSYKTLASSNIFVYICHLLAACGILKVLFKGNVDFMSNADSFGKKKTIFQQKKYWIVPNVNRTRYCVCIWVPCFRIWVWTRVFSPWRPSLLTGTSWTLELQTTLRPLRSLKFQN